MQMDRIKCCLPAIDLYNVCVNVLMSIIGIVPQRQKNQGVSLQKILNMRSDRGPHEG